MQRCSPRSGGPAKNSNFMGSNNAYGYTLSLNDNLGVPCREGDFTLQETERVQNALRQYQTVRAHIITACTPHEVYQAYSITQEELEDIVLGVGQRDGFGEFVGA